MRSRTASGSRVLRWRRRRDDGATLVEFALVVPVLFVLLFGMIEFGWAFFQLNDVRHGAREGIRLVAVNADPNPSGGSPSDQGERLAQAACERMDRSDGVIITVTLHDLDSNLVYEVGDDAVLVAEKPLSQITNVLAPILDGVALSEKITTRLEQNPDPSINGTTWSCV